MNLFHGRWPNRKARRENREWKAAGEPGTATVQQIIDALKAAEDKAYDHYTHGAPDAFRGSLLSEFDRGRWNGIADAAILVQEVAAK